LRSPAGSQPCLRKRGIEIGAPKASRTRIELAFGDEGEVSHLDGLSVEADDWHFNVRPSNTEPLLRLNLEARSQDLMEAKRDEVIDVIRR